MSRLIHDLKGRPSILREILFFHDTFVNSTAGVNDPDVTGYKERVPLMAKT